jgi:predicted aspartyl protease
MKTAVYLLGAFTIIFAGFAWADPPSQPPSALQASHCSLPQYASIDFATLADGMISLPGAVDGHRGGFLLDTGGFSGVLSWGTAKQLSHPIQNSYVEGVFAGGTALDSAVVANRFELGPLSFANVRFLVAPDRMIDPELVGNIQPHSMSNVNFEIDFLKGKFNVFGPSACLGHDAYWTHDAYAKVPMDVSHEGHISVEARLDGKPVNVIIDTGAQNSIMSLKAARRLFDIDEKNPGFKPLGSTNVNNMVTASTYRWPFASLTFEGIEIKNPDILIMDTGADSRAAELVVGIGVLRQLHLYIAYDERMLYLSAAEAH